MEFLCFKNNNKNNSLIFSLVVLLGMCVTFVTKADVEVGSIPGSFEVSNSGAATYSLPLDIAPGINGVQPSLNISYSSVAGFGLLGYGFDLSGVSVISRCPKSKAELGYIDPIDFDGNEDFCFNGMRLVWIQSEGMLRSEISGSIRIQPIGGLGNPEYFILHGGDGDKVFFGGTENGVSNDARLIKEGSNDVLAWSLKVKEDFYGNKVTYSYRTDINDGLFSLDKINYAENEISFAYTNILNSETGFSAPGFKAVRDHVISKIEVLTNGKKLWSYDTTYEDSSFNKKLLKTIKKCDSNGSCYPPVNFDWYSNTGKPLYAKQGSIGAQTIVFDTDVDQYQVTPTIIMWKKGNIIYAKQNDNQQGYHLGTQTIVFDTNVDEFQTAEYRIAWRKGDVLYVKEGGLGAATIQFDSGVEQFQLTSNRIAWLKDGVLYIKEGSLGGAPTITFDSEVDSFILGDERIFWQKNGVLYAKSGGIGSPTIAFDANVDSYQFSGNIVGWLKSGNLYIKEGTLSASTVLFDTGVENFQLAGDRLAWLKKGVIKVKEGDMYGSPVVTFDSGVDYYQLTADRFGWIKNNTLYMKQDSLTSSTIEYDTDIIDLTLSGDRIFWKKKATTAGLLKQISNTLSETITINYDKPVHRELYSSTLVHQYPLVESSFLSEIVSQINYQNENDLKSISYTYSDGLFDVKDQSGFHFSGVTKHDSEGMT